MSANQPTDPMDFLKNMWSSMGMPLPGMVTPTLDTDELEKRITDLKAVEGWLRTNLGMLQMTIQGLEMQRTTLAAMHAISQSASNADANAANPFTNSALWPWNFMQQAASAAGGATATAGASGGSEGSGGKSSAAKAEADAKIDGKGKKPAA